MDSLSVDELRHMVSDPSMELETDLFYRIHFKVNLSMLSDGLFEIPRHRFYHVRLSKSYRECVVLYKSMNTVCQMQYNLVVSTRPRVQSRCYNLLVNSMNIMLISKHSTYMQTLKYVEHFPKQLRAAAINKTGKRDFLVLGVPCGCDFQKEAGQLDRL